MPGSTSRWDQHEDPRDNTVDLPRVDVGGLTDYFRRAAPMLEPEPAGLLEPLPEEGTVGPLEPPSEADPGPARGSRDSSQPRGYLMPDAAHPDELLRDPYAGPTDALRRPSVWRPVEPPERAVGNGSTPASGMFQTPPEPEVERVASTPVAATPSVTPSGSRPGTPTAAGQDAASAPPAAAAGLAEEPEAAEAPVAAALLAEEPEAAAAPVAAALLAEEPEAAAAPETGRVLPAAQPAAPAEPDPATPPTEPARPAVKPAGPTAATGAHSRSAGFGAAPARRAPAGSLADLRSRLAQLPDGHPSSPYEDDGHAKPQPIRLKQLELGLPAPGRELAAGLVPDAEADDVQLDLRQDSIKSGLPQSADRPGEPAAAASRTGDAAQAKLPQADDLAPAARVTDEPAAEIDSESAGVTGSRPAHPELADPYARADYGRSGRDGVTQLPADVALGMWQATASPRAGGPAGPSRGGNGPGTSNGHANGSQRESLLRADRPGLPLGDGGRGDTAQHHMADPPTAEVRELIERTLAAARTAEGRNTLGSYGSSGLTPAMQRLAAHLPFGGLAPGSEEHSLKSQERLTAKLTRLTARNPGRSAEELAAAIGDVVRYAFAFDAADYVEGTWLVHRRLKSHGFELEIRRNRWESPEYKGIFTQWRDPAHDVAFEVQFHTMASWAVVRQTHDAYVQITNPATPAAERARLRTRQVAAAATAKAPTNWTEFDDFRLDAR